MSRRLHRSLSQLRYGAAEGVLGLTALILAIWLLWPDDNGPKLDQRAAWQESLKRAEEERAARQAAKKPLLASDVSATPDVAHTENRPARNDQQQQSESKNERRVIAKPSEWADRLIVGSDRWMRLQHGASADSLRVTDVKPTPARPVTEPLEPIDIVSEAEAAQRALDQVVTEVNLDDEPVVEDPTLEVSVLSTEAIDAAPKSDPAFNDLDRSLPVETFDIKSEPVAHIRRRPRDDAPSWLKNAVTTASLADDRPMIAVVLDDLGLNRTNTKALNQLPAPLTLAFLPYAGRIEQQVEAAQQAGHELMLHLPMEPFGPAWPGPDALVTSIKEQEFAARLQKNLNRFEGFVGINNHMGSRLTADRGRMDLIMRELRRRDILFLDSKTSSRSVAVEMANRNGVPNTIRDVFLDHVIDLGTIRRQMAVVERIARRSGSAVAIGHPHNATLEALRGWLPGLASRGFELVPISAVVARRACSEGVLIAAETCGRYLQAKKPDLSLRAEGG